MHKLIYFKLSKSVGEMLTFAIQYNRKWITTWVSQYLLLKRVYITIQNNNVYQKCSKVLKKIGHGHGMVSSLIRQWKKYF